MDDVRLAVRQLVRSPGFTLVAVVLLSVGLGAGVLTFGIVDAVLWRPLPVPRPHELARIVQRIPRIGTSSAFHYSFYQALRERSTTLATVFGEAPLDVAMTHPAPAERVRVHMSTPELFEALNVPPLLGRALTQDDEAETRGGMAPAVLSYGFWQRRFAGDPAAIGRTMVLRDRLFVIVGVMPRTFNGISIDTAPDVRVPLSAFAALWSSSEPFHIEAAQLDLAGRLRPGVTLAQARAETLVIWQAAIEPYATRNPHGRGVYDDPRTGVDLDPLERGVSILRDRYAAALTVLFVYATLLLVMVCANIAGLFLTRVAHRRGEIGVRLALGATRWRLARQTLVEAALLTAVGAAGGLLLAVVLSPSIAYALPPLRDIAAQQVPLSIDFAPNGRVLSFALAVSLLTALLSGIAPAAMVARTNIERTLRAVRSSSRWRGRQAIVAFQIALCTALLVMAGLLVRSVERLQSVDAGFDRDRVVTFTLDPSLSGYGPPQTRAIVSALTGRIREMPDVVSVALAARGVMRGRGIGMTVAPSGQQPSTADFLATNVNLVSPEYFETMGMRLVAGRGFTNAEAPDGPPQRVAVNQAFVRRFFADTEPIGQRFGPAAPGSIAQPIFEIAGVVSDAKYRSLREPMMPAVYQHAGDLGAFVLHVRVRGRPESAIPSVHQAIATLDPGLPVIETSTLAEEVEASTASERLTAALASLFALIAALVAAIGLYGLLAFVVGQQRHEIGIRIALGAQARHIGALLGRAGLAMVVIGLPLGLGTAAAITHWMRSLLYGVASMDPASFAAASALVTLVAASAIAVPAARAARLDPAAALRQKD